MWICTFTPSIHLHAQGQLHLYILLTQGRTEAWSVMKTAEVLSVTCERSTCNMIGTSLQRCDVVQCGRNLHAFRRKVQHPISGRDRAGQAPS
jgi:hypothetical protein